MSVAPPNTPPLPAGYRLVLETPSSELFCSLRVAAGLSEKSLEAATRGLPNTLFAALIHHGGETVGMGRVIGDGGLFFEIVDMAVHPAHQRRGLGTAIFGALMDFLHRTAPPTAHVTLIADGHAHRLYSRFGLKPVEPESMGMAYRFGAGPLPATPASSPPSANSISPCPPQPSNPPQHKDA